MDTSDGLLVYRSMEHGGRHRREIEAEARWARDLRVRVGQAVQRSSRDSNARRRLTNSPTSVFQATVEGPLGRTGMMASMDLQSLSGRRTGWSARGRRATR